MNEILPSATRRSFLQTSGLSLGAMALAELLGREQAAAAPQGSDNPLAPRAPHFTPKAKAVIYLHMIGAPSQLDLFDEKPELVKRHNEPCPPEVTKGPRLRLHRQDFRARRLPVEIRQARRQRPGDVGAASPLVDRGR